MKLMKKLLTLILILTLTVGLLVPAGAAAITVGQAQAVTVPNDETPVIFQFVPTQSGWYVFYSYNSSGYDPYGYIMDADQDVMVDGDDTEDGMDFSMLCHMTAGKTYYLAATCYSGSARYTVQIDAISSPAAIAFDRDTYVGSICGRLYPLISFAPAGCAQESYTMTSSNEAVVRISESGDFDFGIPGTATVTVTSASGLTASCTVTVPVPPALEMNIPWTLDAAAGEQYLSFTAPTDGWYGVYSEGDEIDAGVEILDEALEGLNADDGTLPQDNFFAPVYLTAAQRCYFRFRSDNQTGKAEVTVQSLTQATAIDLPQDRITGYPDTVCRLTPVYVPQISVPEELTWVSSDETLVQIDGNGTLRFLKPGNAVVTVITETGKTDTVAVTVLPVPTDTDPVDWGICGPNLQWQLSSTGTLTITGSGDMYDLYDNDGHWDDHRSKITSVVFPEGITGIGYGAFLSCTGLTEVELPDSIRRIGGSAFSGCSNLTRITLPDTLDYLGPEVFDFCIALQQVNLPGNLKRIPACTFRSCRSLTQITLPPDLVSIGDNAFSGCAMENIDLPEGLKTIGYCAFAGTRLEQLQLPEGLTQIRDYAFVNCRLDELIIPATVTDLGCGFVSGNPAGLIRFLGKAPNFDEYALADLTVTAYYPACKSGWTEAVRQNYGGTVSWIQEGCPVVTLSGSVTENALLTLTSEDREPETVTAQNGSYRFDDLHPGLYTLTATVLNHVPRTYIITLEEDDVTQAVTLHLVGDVDGNGKVNIGDVAKINAHIKGKTLLTDEYMLECANVNGGKLNMGDSATLYAHIRGTKKLY